MLEGIWRRPRFGDARGAWPGNAMSWIMGKDVVTGCDTPYPQCVRMGLIPGPKRVGEALVRTMDARI
jgi:hypothetical protein